MSDVATTLRSTAVPQGSDSGGERARRMSEQTVFHTSALPEGKDWVWHPDINLVELSDRLDCTGRAQAVIEVSRWWRRAHLKVVETA